MRVLLMCVMAGMAWLPPVYAQQPDASRPNCEGLTDNNQTIQCLKKQNQSLNHEINIANDNLRDKLKAAEQTLPKRYRGKLLKHFKNANKAWEKYRLTQCEYERLHALGGIEEPIVDLQCRNELSRQRLAVLQEQIKMWSY